MESRDYAAFRLKAFIAIACLSVFVLCLRGGMQQMSHDFFSITVMAIGVPLFGAALVAFLLRRNQSNLLSQELERALKELADAETSERNRLARELHDGVCQMLMATRCYLELANEQRFKSQDEFAKYFSSGLQQLEGAIDETRRVSRNLKPALLSRFEFTDAVRHVGREFGERTKIQVSIRSDKGEISSRMTLGAQAALIRVVQEALANVERHSECSRVQLRLRQKDDSLYLSIADNGCGFNASAINPPGCGIGLGNMQERVAEIGGTLMLQPVRKGTKIVAQIPLEPQHDPADGAGHWRKSSLGA